LQGWQDKECRPDQGSRIARARLISEKRWQLGCSLSSAQRVTYGEAQTITDYVWAIPLTELLILKVALMLIRMHRPLLDNRIRWTPSEQKTQE
jgi:hypothetical protein